MLIYGIDVPEMNADLFASILKENPKALVHFQSPKDWEWYIIGANVQDVLNPSVFAMIIHEGEKAFGQFPFRWIEDGLNGEIDLDFKETPLFDLYLDCDDLPDLYAQEHEENPMSYVHFIKETKDGGAWEWHITEGRKEDDGDWTLFGLVNGFEKEIGYVMLSELASVGAIQDLDYERIGIMDIYDDFDLRR